MPGKGSAIIGRQFARDMRAVLLESSIWNYRRTAKRLRLLQRAYQAKAMRADARLEIRRRIAEALLSQAIVHGCSHATCRAGFNMLADLGFSTMESKAHYCLLYARSALEQGHKRTAHRIAEATYGELSKWLTAHHSLLGKQLLGLTGTFLQELFKVKPRAI